MIDLGRIESQFTTAVSGTISEQARKEIVGELKTAYKEYKVQTVSDAWRFQMAKIFYLYGRAIYGGDMVAPHNALKLSTAYQLAGMGRLEVQLLPTLGGCEELENLAQLQCPERVDELLMQADAEELSAHEQAFSFACSLRWLCATEQNLEKFKGDLDRLEKLYGLARAIQEKVDTVDSRWEVAGIIYNGERWLTSQRQQGNVDEALAVLDRLDPYIENEKESLRSKFLQAQIENMRSLLLGNKIKTASNPEEKTALQRQQFNHCSNAANYMESVGKERDQFLFTLFRSNLLKLALDGRANKVELATMDQMNSWATTILADMEREKFSHFYYSMFLFNVAHLRFLQGKNFEALSLLKKAAQIVNANPDNVQAAVARQRIRVGQLAIGPFVLGKGLLIVLGKGLLITTALSVAFLVARRLLR